MPVSRRFSVGLFPTVFAAALAFAPAALLFAQGASRPRSTCLHYEPELVRLSGTLERTDASGSGAAWILRLSEPICTTGPDDTNRPERDVREVELLARGGMLAQFADLAGKTVTASGTLFHSRGGHARSPVQMTVRGVSRHARGESNRQAAPNPNPSPNAPIVARGSRTKTEALLDALVRDLDERLAPSAARDLAVVQARWQELAERDCRWEASLAEDGAVSPGVYASCLDRARRDRIRRLRDLVCPDRGLTGPCEDSRRYDPDAR